MVDTDDRQPPLDREIGERIEEIRADHTSGASALSRRAAQVLALVAQEARVDSSERLVHTLREVAAVIAGSRPAMAAVANTAGLLAATAGEASSLDLPSLRERVASKAQEVVAGWERSAEAIAGHASKVLPSVVMTHSYSASVLAALTAGKVKGRRVIVCESRPLYEGRRLAEELASAGVEVTLITDGQAGHFMAESEAALVGADSVLADGSLINKAGTYLLALAARDRGIPFYAACETLKVSAQREWTAERAEEKEGTKVWWDPPVGVVVRNLYFDRTPAHLVTKLITEEGTLSPTEIGHWVERAERYARALSQ